MTSYTSFHLMQDSWQEMTTFCMTDTIDWMWSCGTQFLSTWQVVLALWLALFRLEYWYRLEVDLDDLHSAVLFQNEVLVRDPDWLYLGCYTSIHHSDVRSVAGFRGLCSSLITQFWQFLFEAEECGHKCGTLRQFVPRPAEPPSDCKNVSWYLILIWSWQTSADVLWFWCMQPSATWST